MRCHYKYYLENNIKLRIDSDFEYKSYPYLILMPPVLKKNIDKILDRSDAGNSITTKRVSGFKF